MNIKSKATTGYFQTDPGVTTIYAGNLDYTVNELYLKRVFEKFGKVKYVNIVLDKETNKSTGIAFVQMPNGKHAKEAIDQLNGSDLEGRILKVSVAQNRIPPKEFSKPRVRTKIVSKTPETEEEISKEFKVKRKRDRGLKLLFDHIGK